MYVFDISTALGADEKVFKNLNVRIEVPALIPGEEEVVNCAFPEISLALTEQDPAVNHPEVTY